MWTPRQGGMREGERQCLFIPQILLGTCPSFKWPELYVVSERDTQKAQTVAFSAWPFFL